MASMRSFIVILNLKIFYLTRVTGSNLSTLAQQKTWADLTSKVQGMALKVRSLSNTMWAHRTTWHHNAFTTRHHKKSQIFTLWAAYYISWKLVRLHSQVVHSSLCLKSHCKISFSVALNCSHLNSKTYFIIWTKSQCIKDMTSNR